MVRFEDNDDPLPLRVFAVYEKNGDDWRMIALQESLAVEQPGTGVAFKKVVAPLLPLAPAVAVAAAKPVADAQTTTTTTKTKKTKKKKRKKPKPVDDE